MIGRGCKIKSLWELMQKWTKEVIFYLICKYKDLPALMIIIPLTWLETNCCISNIVIIILKFIGDFTN